MKYQIAGVDASSGSERVVEIEAESEEEAVAQAKSQGLFTYRIKVIHEIPYEAAHPPPTISERNDVPIEVDVPVRCPNCNSSHVTAQKRGFSLGTASLGCCLLSPIFLMLAPIFIPLGLLTGLIGSSDVQIICLKCGSVFDPGSAN